MKFISLVLLVLLFSSCCKHTISNNYKFHNPIIDISSFCEGGYSSNTFSLKTIDSVVVAEMYEESHLYLYGAAIKIIITIPTENLKELKEAKRLITENLVEFKNNGFLYRKRIVINLCEY